MLSRRFGRKLARMSGLIEVSILSFIVIFALGIYDMVIPLFIEDFEASPFLIGMSVSLVYIASFIFETPMGSIVDMYGRRRVLTAGLFGLGIIGITYYLSQSFLHVLLLAVIFGTVSLTFWIPSAVLVREDSPKKGTASAFGIFLTSSQLGWIFGPVLAGFIAFYYGLKFNFLAIAALMFIAMAYTIFFIRKKKLKKHKAGFKTPFGIFKRYATMHKHAVPLYFTSMVLNMWIGTEWVFIQLAGGNVFHFNEMLIGVLLGAMMTMEGLLFMVSSFFMDRVGKAWVMLAGFLLLYASTYFVFLSSGWAQFVVFVLLAAAAVAWIFPGCEAVLTDIAPRNELGEMTSVLDSSKDLGLALGPTIGGALITYTGNYMMPFLLISVLAGISVFISYLMARKKKEEKKLSFINALKQAFHGAFAKSNKASS